MFRTIRRNAAFALCLSFCLPFAGAEIMSSDRGFYLDPPEGYALTAPVEDGRFSFADSQGMAELNIIAYSGSAYASAEAMAKDLGKRLSAEYKGKSFAFQGRGASFGKIKLSLGGSAREGYAFMMNGRGSESDFLVLSTTLSALAASYDPMLLSAVDSFCPDAAGLRLPGPVSSSAMAGGKPVKTAAVKWNGAELALHAQPGESGAAQALVDREAGVLALYGDSPLWAEAWARFFRMVYRDCYRSLDEFSFLFGLEVERIWYAEGKVVGTLSADAFPAPDPGEPVPPAAYASAVLDFVNSFTYLRDPAGSDFVNPIDAVLEGKGDCDARALVAAIVLHHLNQDAALMVSASYSHAMALVDLPGSPGRNAGIEVGGKRFLAAETTRREPPGTIDPDMSVAEEWLGIPLDF